MITRLVLLLVLLAASPARAEGRTKKPVTPKEAAKGPELMVAEAQLVRRPAGDGAQGARLRTGVFPERLRAGTRVSVVPAGAAPFTTIVEAVEHVEDNERARSGWRLDLVLPPDADRSALRDGVVVVWPPIPDARSLDTAALRSSDLPTDTTAAVVKAALSWHSRGQPDMLILDLCCSTRERFDMKSCDAECTELHLRERGHWRKTGALTRS